MALVGRALAFSQYAILGRWIWGAIFRRENSDKKVSAIGVQCRPEATDWSYLQAGRDHQQVFHDFIWRLNEAGIGISLYDVKK